MCKTAHGLTTILILATITALIGIAACADVTTPHHDCPITNGPDVCKAS